MIKHWNILKHDRNIFIPFAEKLNISPLAAALLISRGIDNEEKADKFLKPSTSDLHEPNLLKDLDKAVERIFRAIENQERS